MSEILAKFSRLLVCAYYLDDGWTAKYTQDYNGSGDAYQTGKTIPEKFARELFPKMHGRYVKK